MASGLGSDLEQLLMPGAHERCRCVFNKEAPYNVKGILSENFGRLALDLASDLASGLTPDLIRHG
jgi:hypothetical protein